MNTCDRNKFDVLKQAIELLQEHLYYASPEGYSSSAESTEVTRRWLQKQDRPDLARKAIEMVGMD